MTLTRPWSNIRTAHGLNILDICAVLFENPTRGLKDIDWTRKRDRRTDRQLVKIQYVSLFHGERHNAKIYKGTTKELSFLFFKLLKLPSNII